MHCVTSSVSWRVSIQSHSVLIQALEVESMSRRGIHAGIRAVKQAKEIKRESITIHDKFLSDNPGVQYSLDAFNAWLARLQLKERLVDFFSYDNRWQKGSGPGDLYVGKRKYQTANGGFEDRIVSTTVFSFRLCSLRSLIGLLIAE